MTTKLTVIKKVTHHIMTNYCVRMCTHCRRDTKGFWKHRHDDDAYVHDIDGNVVPCPASKFHALIDDLERM